MISKDKLLFSCSRQNVVLVISILGCTDFEFISTDSRHARQLHNTNNKSLLCSTVIYIILLCRNQCKVWNKKKDTPI